MNAHAGGPQHVAHDRAHRGGGARRATGLRPGAPVVRCGGGVMWCRVVSCHVMTWLPRVCFTDTSRHVMPRLPPGLPALFRTRQRLPGTLLGESTPTQIQNPHCVRIPNTKTQRTLLFDLVVCLCLWLAQASMLTASAPKCSAASVAVGGACLGPAVPANQEKGFLRAKALYRSTARGCGVRCFGSGVSP